eukprot:7542574-Lingulodinium_polyedra.AAC.1
MLALGIHLFERLDEAGPLKTHQELFSATDRRIARARVVTNRERQARVLSQGPGQHILAGAPAE